MRTISSIGWFDAINNKATIAHFTRDKFGKLLIPLPPPSEQAAIVKYLDYMTRRIDKAIRVKKKLIQLLNEQKQVIIHQAVTRGLNPDVPLKDSGVPWLGMVPEHWEVRKLKQVMSFIGGGTPDKSKEEYWNGTIPWVSPKDMKSDDIFETQDQITQAAIQGSSTNLVPSGSILIVVRSGILKHSIPIAITRVSVAINQDMKALIPKISLDTGYFVSFVRGCKNDLLILWTKQGATVESIENSLMVNTLIPFPPFEEQVLIAEAIRGNIERFNQLIEGTRQGITLLNEYRTRLIADVVTGQIDVREIAAQLPDEQEDVEPFDLEDVEEVLMESEQDD